MDFGFTFTPEHEQFRQEVRKWLDENVTPGIEGPLEDTEYTEEMFKKNREFREKWGAQGWYAADWPKEYGGGGLTPEHAIILEQEISSRVTRLEGVFIRGDIAFSAAGAILKMGNDEQKKRFLPDIMNGKSIVWELFTEPGSGSDLPSMKTTAIRDGDEYVLNGSKTFVATHNSADWMFTLAVTDTERPRHNNIGAFMVSYDTPGVTVHPLPLLGHMKRTIFLEDVRVPAQNLVGKENEGWAAFGAGRGGGASMVVDRGRHGDELLEWSKSSIYDGQPVSKDPELRDVLVDAYIDDHLRQLLNLRNYWMHHAKVRASYHGQQAGLYRKTHGPRLAERYLQVMGPRAVTRDYQWGGLEKGGAEYYARDAIIMTHPGGTVEIHKMRMWRGMVGFQREGVRSGSEVWAEGAQLAD